MTLATTTSVSPVSPIEAVRIAYRRIAAAGRSSVWIHLRPEADALAAAEQVDPSLPLAGLTLAVKDNIDVAGMPTTAACPAFGYDATENAPVVERLIAAGAIVLGKTNLDQFATGLVGTRSPYGIVANSVDHRYVAGGSSSGSAVAVALGMADLALGTDTAGSGRVPAAFNGIVGLKPSPGLLSTRGVVPACRSLDCVSIFARTVQQAWRVLEVAATYDPLDPYSSPGRLRGGLPVSSLRLGVPDIESLDLAPAYRDAFRRAVDQLAALVGSIAPISLEPFFAAGDLLYDGALVAERYAAVGAFIDSHHDVVDPVVGKIISTSGLIRAERLAADLDRLQGLRRQVSTVWDDIDVFVVPTAPMHPRIAEVFADPIGMNSRVGRYSTFCNPLGLSALAVPAGVLSDGMPFGITLYGPGLGDATVAALGAALCGERPPAPVSLTTDVRIAVVGAHLSGQPLNWQLVDRGARLVASTTTSADYALYALATDPPKPGLVRVREGGQTIEVELWEMAASDFADFVIKIPPPLGVGQLELVDGSTVTGFICTPSGLEGATDITAYGGWRSYLSR